MSFFFSPPTAPERPAAIRPGHPGFSLFRHYAPWQAGINVFLLLDGSVTTAEPYGTDSVARTFHGGHIHKVTPVERDLLVAAGFAVTVNPDVAMYEFSTYDESFYATGSFVPVVAPTPGPVVPSDGSDVLPSGPALPGGDYNAPIGAGVYFDRYSDEYEEPGFPGFDSTVNQQSQYGNTYTDVYGLVSEDNTP